MSYDPPPGERDTRGINTGSGFLLGAFILVVIVFIVAVILWAPWAAHEAADDPPAGEPQSRRITAERIHAGLAPAHSPLASATRPEGSVR